MAPTGMKGPGVAPKMDGSGLRIGIVHARWNIAIIEPLLEGTKKKLREAGVKDENIVIQSVPGSWYTSSNPQHGEI
jgi:6,7-dimethyl-8-ribityllumazine synthase